eukprot:9493614-Pyramimonas_sp.AAC.1
MLVIVWPLSGSSLFVPALGASWSCAAVYACAVPPAPRSMRLLGALAGAGRGLGTPQILALPPPAQRGAVGATASPP